MDFPSSVLSFSSTPRHLAQSACSFIWKARIHRRFLVGAAGRGRATRLTSHFLLLNPSAKSVAVSHPGSLLREIWSPLPSPPSPRIGQLAQHQPCAALGRDTAPWATGQWAATPTSAAPCASRYSCTLPVPSRKLLDARPASSLLQWKFPRAKYTKISFKQSQLWE